MIKKSYTTSNPELLTYEFNYKIAISQLTPSVALVLFSTWEKLSVQEGLCQKLKQASIQTC